METIDRFRGALLGLSCGDAVGTTVEFKARGRLKVSFPTANTLRHCVR